MELLKLLKAINKKVSVLNNSKFFAGVLMIMLNLGSKYISLNLSKNQEGYLKNALGRQILIFSMSWIGSRDIVTALILTAVFTILADHILNEDSKFCILPKSWKHLYTMVDINNDGEISDEEIENAIKILSKAKHNTIENQRSLAFNNFYYK